MLTKIGVVLILAAALGFAQEPLPVLPIDYVEFERGLTQLTVVSCDVAAVDKELDECLVDLKTQQGILLDMRACSTAADTSLMRLMGRFTKQIMVGDWIEISPRGSWQYDGPLVVWLSEAQSERQLWRLFMNQRRHGEQTITNSQKPARAQLKKLVTKLRAEQADRLQKKQEQAARKRRGLDPKADPRILKPK